MPNESTPSPEVIEILRNIETEIGAGKSFGIGRDHEIWNAAHDRALSIVAHYKQGLGLFQITKAEKARGEETPDAPE